MLKRCVSVCDRTQRDVEQVWVCLCVTERTQRDVEQVWVCVCVTEHRGMLNRCGCVCV